MAPANIYFFAGDKIAAADFSMAKAPFVAPEQVRGDTSLARGGRISSHRPRTLSLPRQRGRCPEGTEGVMAALSPCRRRQSFWLQEAI